MTVGEHVPFARDSGRDETRATFGGDRVAMAGEWHGNIPSIHEVLPRLQAHAADVTTVFQLGDFGLYPKGILAAVEASGIERVLVTPGNHDDWSRLEQRFAARPDEGVQLSEVVWFLPRGFRLTLGGHWWVSVGGAASIDYQRRIEGKDWWPSEIPTKDDVDEAIAGGPVDVLLTHESVNGALDRANGSSERIPTDGAHSRWRIRRCHGKSPGCGTPSSTEYSFTGISTLKEKARWRSDAACIRWVLTVGAEA